MLYYFGDTGNSKGPDPGKKINCF